MARPADEAECKTEREEPNGSVKDGDLKAMQEEAHGSDAAHSVQGLTESLRMPTPSAVCCGGIDLQAHVKLKKEEGGGGQKEGEPPQLIKPEKKEEAEVDEDEECQKKNGPFYEDEEKGPSRLKFPSYEEFLKEEQEAEREEEEAQRKADDENGEEQKGADLDAAFELFMSEVKDMPVAGKPAGEVITSGGRHRSRSCCVSGRKTV